MRPVEDIETQRQRAVLRHRLFGGAAPDFCLGRYRLDAPLGSGAMGVVYRAFDPEMKRPVAIKVVRTEANDTAREGRLLARIAHPNVVSIYDVGRGPGVVYLVMSLVEGLPLDRWLMHNPPWPAIVSVFGDVAKGLGAGHHEGIVHCDVKPSNIIVGGDGRAHLLDLGVAMVLGESRLRGGTPRYCAPELLAGASPTPAADVYSLCVVLAEAIDKHAPGGREPAPRLRRLVVGGQAKNPHARPSVEEVQRALVERERRRPMLLWSAVAMAIGCMGLAMTHDEAIDCGPGPRPWQERAKAAAQAAAQGEPSVAVPLVVALDEHLARWSDASQTACSAGAVTPARWCLDQRRIEVVALIDGLRRDGSNRGITSTLDALYELPEPGRCLTDDMPDARYVAMPMPPEQSRALAATEAASATVDVSEARRQLQEILRQAGAWGWEQVFRRADLALADLEASQGLYDQAAARFEALAWSASAAGDEEAAARAQLGRIYVSAYGEDVADALVWSRHAEASLQRIDRPDLWTVWMNNTALVLMRQGRYDEARELLAQANAAAIESDDPLHPRVAMVADNLGIACRRSGDLESAERFGQAALRIRRERLGTSHPKTADSLSNLGATASAAGHLEEAVTRHLQALEIYREAVGPDSIQVAKSMANLGVAYARSHDLERAEPLLLRSYERHLTMFGPDHRWTAKVARSLATLQLEQGRSAEAKRLMLAAFVGFETALGSAHPATVRARKAWESIDAQPQHDASGPSPHE